MMGESRERKKCTSLNLCNTISNNIKQLMLSPQWSEDSTCTLKLSECPFFLSPSLPHRAVLQINWRQTEPAFSVEEGTDKNVLNKQN